MITADQLNEFETAARAVGAALGEVKTAQSTVESAEKDHAEKLKAATDAEGMLNTAKAKRDEMIAALRKVEVARRAVFDAVFGPLVASPAAPPAV